MVVLPMMVVMKVVVLLAPPPTTMMVPPRMRRSRAQMSPGQQLSRTMIKTSWRGRGMPPWTSLWQMALMKQKRMPQMPVLVEKPMKTMLCAMKRILMRQSSTPAGQGVAPRDRPSMGSVS